MRLRTDARLHAHVIALEGGVCWCSLTPVTFMGMTSWFRTLLLAPGATPNVKSID
jgi:hypothetical protein